MAIHFIIAQTGCFVVSLCDFSEEISHLHTRYHGKYLKVIKASFNRNYAIPISFLCYIFYAEDLWPVYPVHIHLLLQILSQLLCWCLGIQAPTSATISDITERKHLNVAHGLAWSYYVGYLQFVLPALKELVKKFNEENNNLLKFRETFRLHILIPLSCKLYGDLKEADDNITFVKEIPPLFMDRAGIKGRVFKNNVYRILDEEYRPYYCMVEYATPLASLSKMSDITSAAFTVEDRIQQTKLFYRTLKDILEDSHECRNSYRLIIYDDCPKTEDHNEHLLSREILKHMKQQHSEEVDL
ncbi:stimulator of interferon genes protein [Rhinophrynus dorsalis]